MRQAAAEILEKTGRRKLQEIAAPQVRRKQALYFGTNLGFSHGLPVQKRSPIRGWEGRSLEVDALDPRRHALPTRRNHA